MLSGVVGMLSRRRCFTSSERVRCSRRRLFVSPIHDRSSLARADGTGDVENDGIGDEGTPWSDCKNITVTREKITRDIIYYRERCDNHIQQLGKS